jgi:hypothetical protein
MLFAKNKTRRPPGCGKSRSVESEENQKQVFLPSHRPWKSRTTRAIPTFPTAPTAAGFSTSLTSNVGPNYMIKVGQIRLTESQIASHDCVSEVAFRCVVCSHQTDRERPSDGITTSVLCRRGSRARKFHGPCMVHERFLDALRTASVSAVTRVVSNLYFTGSFTYYPM